MMEILNLNQGQWQIRKKSDDAWIPTALPGEVHLALLQAGKIPDPFIGDNELLVQWVAETDWEFMGLIDVPESLSLHDKVWLVFDGLDTLAQVILNGNVLGVADNAFRTYAWEVSDVLIAGENKLRILLKSPVRYVEAQQTERPLISPEQSIQGGPYLRKAPCQWGWDWGPQLPSIGVWKGARLAGYSDAKLDGCSSPAETSI
jgi:beta-mannosidase